MFYGRDGRWTVDQSQALEFEAEQDVIQAAKDLGLDDLELMVVRDGGKFVFGKRLASEMPQNGK